MAKARARYEKLEQDEKYLFYTPNGVCEKFIKVVGSNKHFINLFIAANGVGKTALMVNIIANLIFKMKNKWFNYPLFNKFPYMKEGRIVSDPTSITKTIVPEILKWFPKNKYTTKKVGKHYENEWKTKTNWNFDIMSLDQDVKEFESKTLGWAYFDEPPTEAIFKATIARTRTGGIIMAGFTPLGGSAFFYDNYVTSSDVVVY